MPTLETLTQEDLQDVFRTKSLRRARSYINWVQNPVRTGKTLTAQVRGSRMYDAEIDVEADGIYAQLKEILEQFGVRVTDGLKHPSSPMSN